MKMIKMSAMATGLGLCGALLGGIALAAPEVDPSSQPLGYVAPIVLSDSDLSTTGVKAYRPWF